MGSTYLRVTLINASQGNCRLEGPPRMEQYDRSGRRRKIVPEWPVKSVSTAEGARSLVLAPGGRAVFEIQTSNSTGYEAGRKCGIHLAIHPPRSGRSVIDIPVESCGPIRISGYLPAH